MADHLAVGGKGNLLLHRPTDPKELTHFIEGAAEARCRGHCTGYLAYLFSNKPFVSDEVHGSENERQDLQAVETGEIVGEEAMF